jgi:hypothetical protein
MDNKHLARLIGLALGSALLLAGCGGGGGDTMGSGDTAGAGGGGSDPLAGVPASASQSSQGLVAYLQALVKTAPDNREPAALDGSAPPHDDAAEPQPIS